MAKGFILVDVPEKCLDCCCSESDNKNLYCKLNKKDNEDYVLRGTKPDWCQIRELPERRKPLKFTISPLIKEQYYPFDSGYNACLDYLEGKDGNL